MTSSPGPSDAAPQAPQPVDHVGTNQPQMLALGADQQLVIPEDDPSTFPFDFGDAGSEELSQFIADIWGPGAPNSSSSISDEPQMPFIDPPPSLFNASEGPLDIIAPDDSGFLFDPSLLDLEDFVALDPEQHDNNAQGRHKGDYWGFNQQDQQLQ